MLNAQSGETVIQFGGECPGVSVAGFPHASPASVADLVQAHPALAAMRVPKLTPEHNGESALADAFSKSRCLGQPSESVLFDHIKAMAAMGHLNGDQAGYLAENKRQSVTLWSAIGRLSENRISDQDNEITKWAHNTLLSTYPLEKIIKYALMWKKAFPASIQNYTITTLHRALKATKSGTLSPSQATDLQQATMAVFTNLCGFLNDRLSNCMETVFEPFNPAADNPICIGFGALEGHTFALDVDSLDESLWKTINLALRLIVTNATPGMTSHDLLECEMFMDDADEEVLAIEERIAELGIDENDREAIDTMLEHMDSWLIDCFDSFEHFRECRSQKEVDKERWALDDTAISLDALKSLIDTLPDFSEEQDRKLADWCREAHATLSQIETPWHDVLHGETDCDEIERLGDGLAVMLEDDMAAFEQAENIHRSYMEGGETVNVTVDWDTAPEKIIQFADTVGKGRTLLLDLEAALD